MIKAFRIDKLNNDIFRATMFSINEDDNTAIVEEIAESPDPEIAGRMLLDLHQDCTAFYVNGFGKVSDESHVAFGQHVVDFCGELTPLEVALLDIDNN